MITELLQNHPIQNVKNFIGHKDLRTTEVYDRNFMGEKEFKQALHSVYTKRKDKLENN
jgi:site-specific recombinase XerD